VRLQLLGKEIENACCLRRPRDAWKLKSEQFMTTLVECVHFAKEFAKELWKGDLGHRIFFELVRTAPRRLALTLALELPKVDCAHKSQQDVFERALVCMLRARHQPALQLLSERVLPPTWLLESCSSWKRRLAGHLVLHASPAGEAVLTAALELTDESAVRLLCSVSGARLFNSCLTHAQTRRWAPALFVRQIQLAKRAKRWFEALPRRARGSVVQQARTLMLQLLTKDEVDLDVDVQVDVLSAIGGIGEYGIEYGTDVFDDYVGRDFDCLASRIPLRDLPSREASCAASVASTFDDFETELQNLKASEASEQAIDGTDDSVSFDGTDGIYGTDEVKKAEVRKGAAPALFWCVTDEGHLIFCAPGHAHAPV